MLAGKGGKSPHKRYPVHHGHQRAKSPSCSRDPFHNPYEDRPPIPTHGLHQKAIREAAALLSGRIIRTPLVYSPTFSEMTGAGVYLSFEAMQKAGSFKVRGADQPDPVAEGGDRRELEITAIGKSNNTIGWRWRADHPAQLGRIAGGGVRVSSFIGGTGN